MAGCRIAVALGYPMRPESRFSLWAPVAAHGRDLPFVIRGALSIQSVATITDCRAIFLDFRDRHGLGVSALSHCDVFDGFGAFVCRISYNGAVWRERDWLPGDRAVYGAPGQEGF